MAVAYRLGRGGGGLPSCDGLAPRAPVPHERIARQLVVASSRRGPLTYSDLLIAPHADEDPALVGTVLPAYNTRDSRMAWPYTIRKSVF